MVSFSGKDGGEGVAMNLVLFYPLKQGWRDTVSAQEALRGRGLQGLCEGIWGVCFPVQLKVGDSSLTVGSS